MCCGNCAGSLPLEKTLRTLACACGALIAPLAGAQTTWHGPDGASSPAQADKPTPAKAPPRAAALRRFEPPTVQGLVADQCESWSTNCGDGGAKAFCRLRGYERVAKWEHSKPGRTWVIGSARDCTGDFCTGYRFVE